MTLCCIHSLFINLDSLEVIQLINDQPCPYFEYCPIEKRGSRIDEIIVDDKPSDQRTYRNTRNTSDNHALYYAYKPYE